MIDLNKMIKAEIAKGYDDANAQAKVCQDIVLKAIASSPLSHNITIKGGVVMRSKTRSVRRATQDLDMDFIRYSLADEAIDEFISYLNCLEGIDIKRHGSIEELKQQDYKGKRVYIKISDSTSNSLISKLDLGVHNKLDIKQDEYCFDVAFDDEGASLLINSNEQMFSEKLRSLLRFGTVSTRYKDIFDMYFLKDNIDKDKLRICMDLYVYRDPKMREKEKEDVVRRVESVFQNKAYFNRLNNSDKKWLDEDLNVILGELIIFLKTM